MRIHLMRHGIAADLTDPRYPRDIDRPLTDAGVDLTRRVARALARLDVRPELVITSPALRARQTADIVTEVLEIPDSAREVSEHLLWDRAPEGILSVLSELGIAEVLCTSHAPLVDRLIARLVRAPTGPFTRMKTASVATVHAFPPWTMPGELAQLLTPGTLQLLGDA